MVPSLPIVRTTLDAYRLVWHHRRVLLSLGWPLAIVIVVPQIVMPFFFTPQVRVVAHLPPGQSLIALVWNLVWIALAIPTATSAYRLFIRGSGQRLSLRFSREEWLYVGASFRLAGRTLLLALPMLIVMGICRHGLHHASRLPDPHLRPAAVGGHRLCRRCDGDHLAGDRPASSPAIPWSCPRRRWGIACAWPNWRASPGAMRCA